MELRNRIVMAPMASNFADDKGGVTEQLLEYYRRRVHGRPVARVVWRPGRDLSPRTRNRLCLSVRGEQNQALNAQDEPVRQSRGSLPESSVRLYREDEVEYFNS